MQYVTRRNLILKSSYLSRERKQAVSLGAQKNFENFKLQNIINLPQNIFFLSYIFYEYTRFALAPNFFELFWNLEGSALKAEENF